MKRWNELTRDECVALLEGACGIQCYDHEEVDELREAVRVNLGDGTLDPSLMPER